MTVASWWSNKRYGLRVHANIATVPSFAPIGEDASWYRTHLGEDPLVAGAGHPRPAAEVLAYHRDRWSHIEAFDDFIGLLSFHRFDADELVELATASGMNYLISPAKFADGLCFWDAPLTDRTTIRCGPKRNVLAEIAAACSRAHVLFGTAYSLLDWADPRYPSENYVEQALHPHVIDLVGRYGSKVLWGDANWGNANGQRNGHGDGHGDSQRNGHGDGHGDGHGNGHGNGHGKDQPNRHGKGHSNDSWRAEELFERAQELAELQGHELVFNDRWGHSQPSFSVLENSLPDEIRQDHWEFTRPIGFSAGYNRAERPEHMMSTGALLDLLTEVNAKGGNLLLSVGLAIDGQVSEIQQRPLREVGRWVAEHASIIQASTPFDEWGDALSRYVRVGEQVIAIDLMAATEATFSALVPDRYEIGDVVANDGAAVHWEQSRAGLSVNRTDRTPLGLAGVYCVDLRPAAEAISLFDPARQSPKPVQALLDAAVNGDIVQLSEGVYLGPISVPDGVTLRGLGWDRTAIEGEKNEVILGIRSRVEHLDVRVGDVRLVGAFAAARSCRVGGEVTVTGDDATVQLVIARHVNGDADRTTIERCTLRGTPNEDGIQLSDGVGHNVAHNEVIGHSCNIHLRHITASLVQSNRLQGHISAIHLEQCEHIQVNDNTIQGTMRAITVTGGSSSTIVANWISDGDSGCLIEFGANDIAVVDNRIERCRIGILTWDASAKTDTNTFVELFEDPAVVTGPD